MNKTSHQRTRFIADATLFFAVLFAPWWLLVILVFAGILYFKNFYEAFFCGLLFDMLYGANIVSLHGFRFVFSSAFLFLIVAAELVKGNVRT